MSVMTAAEIEEHNRVFAQATQLVKGKIIVQGPQLASVPADSATSDLARAIQLFTGALELNPANWSAMWLIGKAYQRLADHSSAFVWFVRAQAVNPLQADILREVSISAMYSGRSEEAISYAREALGFQPSNDGLQANLALALLLAGKLQEARVAIDKALKRNARNIIAQRLSEMIAHFMTTGRTPPKSTDALEGYWKEGGLKGGAEGTASLERLAACTGERSGSTCRPFETSTVSRIRLNFTLQR